MGVKRKRGGGGGGLTLNEDMKQPCDPPAPAPGVSKVQLSRSGCNSSWMPPTPAVTASINAKLGLTNSADSAAVGAPYRPGKSAQVSDAGEEILLCLPHNLQNQGPSPPLAGASSAEHSEALPAAQQHPHMATQPPNNHLLARHILPPPREDSALVTPHISWRAISFFLPERSRCCPTSLRHSHSGILLQFTRQ